MTKNKRQFVEKAQQPALCESSHNRLSLSHCSCQDVSQVISGGLGQEGSKPNCRLLESKSFPPNWSGGWEGFAVPPEVFKLSVIEKERQR